MRSFLRLTFVAALLVLATQIQSGKAWGQVVPGFKTGCIPVLMNCAPSAGHVGHASPQVAGLPGKWTQDSFSNHAGSRNYYLYVPAKNSGQTLPLMVMLHGCFQGAADFATQTGMNAVAEKYGFAVLYPEQGYQDNVWKCWNFFRPENQERNGGEMSIVLGMMQAVSKTVKIDSRRIYVAGLSAGAAMASNLVACHSDLFSGAGIASGMEYKAATSEAEAHSVMSSGSTHDLKESAADAVKCTGKNARVSAIIVVHGTQDSTVNPVNGDRVIKQFTVMNDLIDDGRANETQNDRVIASRVDQVPNGYRYKSEFFGGNGAVHLAKVSVEGMSHAWSGAAQSGQYMDPKGPNASEMIWLFLSNYGKGRR